MRYWNMWRAHSSRTLIVGAALACTIAGLLQTAAAQPFDIVQVGEHISICVDPPSPTLIVRSELEKVHEKACKTWSRYRSTVANLAVDKFKKCNPAVPVVNQFAGEILSAWVGRRVDPPGTVSLFNEPARHGVRALQEGEARTNKLIVWSGGGAGMVGVVLKDDNDAATREPDLAKLQVLYPSIKECGELKIIDAKTLASSLPAASRFKLLEIILPQYFWNHWLDGVASQADSLSDADTYSYRIDFSPLDFRQVLVNPEARPAPLKSDEVQPALPMLGDLRLIVLPFGNVELVDQAGSFEKTVKLDVATLNATLTSRNRSPYPSLNALAAQEGALRWNNNGTNSQIYVQFRVTGTGCAGFSTIVWSNQGGQPRLVAAWTRGFFVYQADSQGSIGKGEDQCGQSEEVARRLDPAVVVPQFPVSGQRPAVRLTFVDLKGASIGALEDLDALASPTLTWTLESTALREKLSLVVSDYDKKVSAPDFNANEISGPLERLLFTCRTDKGCAGPEALAHLRMLAATRPGVRVEARFRDSSNASYYVPIQLLQARTDGSETMLGELLRIVYPLPFSSRLSPAKQTCVRSWAAGLVVKDDTNHLTSEWQKNWPGDLASVKAYDVKSYLEIDKLRDYFKSSDASKSAEGLIILAHHGGGKLAARSDDPGLAHVDQDQLNKILRSGSFGMFASCSVGAVGEGQRSNASFLHALNQRNMDAAIASPYKVPNEFAKALLEKFREVVIKLQTEKSLNEVFADTRAELLNADTQLIHSNAKLLMLLGDGDVRICKP